jgi:hypothetical protein
MRDLKILAWVHLATGALTLLVAAFFFDLVRTGTDPDDVVAGAVIGGLLGVKAASSLVLGWGLLALKPWSRMLGIVLSVLHLPLIPVGTAIGIFGLMVLPDLEVRALLSGDRARRAEHIAF